LLFAILAGCLNQSSSIAATAGAKTGILVVTPDRGFLGNEEINDGFERFAARRNAGILFVTDARSKDILDQRLTELAGKGAEQIIVLPLFISTADARWQMAQRWIVERQKKGENLSIAKPYGSSYLAVEDLSDRLRQTPTDKKQLLLVGYGAVDAESAAQMKSELTQMGESASVLLAKDIQVAVSPTWGAADKDLRTQYNAAIKNAHNALVVPVLLANRADSMMSFLNGLTRSVPKDAQLVTSEFSTAEELQQWMEYATNQAFLQSSDVKSKDIGVIALAHGADWFWNQDIRDALAPQSRNHPLAFAFSMADQPSVERAVREIEKKPVHGIVLVRVFGEASSFRSTVLRMIGADAGNGKSGHHGGHDDMGDMGGMDMSHGGMNMSHGGHAAMSTLAAAPRIRTNLPIITVGGVEDSPYFAKALLANARSISVDPSRETIILTAHGAGSDADNEHWLGLLANLGNQMKAEDGYNFKDIRYVTWREDWPDKNKDEVANARKLVKQINDAGGRVLIVPARINGRGAADRYLKGLNFGWSQGFAQTPYLSQWFGEQVTLGINQLTGAQPASPHEHEHAHEHHAS